MNFPADSVIVVVVAIAFVAAVGQFLVFCCHFRTIFPKRQELVDISLPQRTAIFPFPFQKLHCFLQTLPKMPPATATSLSLPVVVVVIVAVVSCLTVPPSPAGKLQLQFN